MILNTLAAVCAGFVLNFMFGRPPGVLDPERLIGAFSARLEKTLRRFYEESPEALRMAGGVLTFLCLLIFAGVPLALLMIGYTFPLVGLVLDCFFCWAAFSVRDTKFALGRVLRGVRSGNLDRARKELSKITGEDHSQLDSDDIIRRAVECAADCAGCDGSGALFYSAIAGGFGGMFYRCVCILNKNMPRTSDEYVDFGRPARKLWEILSFLPSRIACLVLRADIGFLKLDRKNSRKVCRRDRKKLWSPALAPCRCALSGALDIRLSREEYYDGALVRDRFIGDQIKPCQPNDIYWANQLMYGTIFGVLLIAAIVRIALFIIL